MLLSLNNTNSVRYGVGRAGFALTRPAVKQGRGDIFGVMPALPRFLPTYFYGALLGNGQGRGQGHRTQKKQPPAQGRSVGRCGEFRRAPAFFGVPEAP